MPLDLQPARYCNLISHLGRLSWVFVIAGICGCLNQSQLLARSDSDLQTCAYTPPEPIQEEGCQSLPEQRRHVHIYFIHGLDPLDVANLRGVRAACEEQGFCHTTLAQWFHGPWIIDRIARVKADDPEARIVIFAFSAGTLTARQVISRLDSKHGIHVDTVIYTSGITLGNNAYSRPESVGKVIHIRDATRVINSTNIAGADNYKYGDVWHFGTPTHPNTLAVLSQELDALAGGIPVTLHQQPTAVQTAKISSSPTWQVARPTDSLAAPPTFVIK